MEMEEPDLARVDLEHLEHAYRHQKLQICRKSRMEMRKWIWRNLISLEWIWNTWNMPTDIRNYTPFPGIN